MASLMSENNRLLGQVRMQTDASLANERSKSDFSFSQAQNAAEVSADSLVKKNRLRTDSAQIDERKLHDAKKEEARSSIDDQDLESEREMADSSLEQERRASDLMQKQERANADAAITKERRRTKLAAEALFSLERSNTDADLLKEREHVDSEAEHVASHLSVEVNAHTNTKTLMAVMSRDLKDPLNSILKLGETLQAFFISEKVVSPQIHRLLGMIRRNSSSMERLVADMLDLESLNEGNLSLNLAEEDLAEVLSECSHIFGIVANAKNIEFTTSCDASPLMATFDRDRILQVFSNLIQYAFTHTPNNRSIAIRAVDKGSHIEVSIVDDGDGTPAKEQAGIFDKAAQVTNLRLQKSGLGLYVCKGIVEAHGGTILFESNPGKGSTFRFTLPKA